MHFTSIKAIQQCNIVSYLSPIDVCCILRVVGCRRQETYKFRVRARVVACSPNDVQKWCQAFCTHCNLAST